eukprot:Gregarina_sp_Poly_1__4866@NODE_2590_length_1940_cov_66_028831_g1643_i0_p1_GENE_NODE_2590_length_1940_cov_66_028831_g1643_i0NODE_2590_length_1940_cov_66_028831_g1643_i0_p1_ORF_typecomplete_len107_score10_89_NODE_2590_length_1940_cov_66_028831_g1643_i0246566
MLKWRFLNIDLNSLSQVIYRFLDLGQFATTQGTFIIDAQLNVLAETSPKIKLLDERGKDQPKSLRCWSLMNLSNRHPAVTRTTPTITFYFDKEKKYSTGSPFVVFC